MKKLLAATVLVGLVVAGAVTVLPSVYNTYLDLTFRFRLLEERSRSYGEYIAQPLETYQSQRGDALVSTSERGIVQSNGSWNKLETPWRKDYFKKTKAIEVFDGNLVVGLEGQKPGDAAVYRYDSNSWRLIGSSEIVEGWERLKYVQVLREFGGDLYAGINNEVWVFGGSDSLWRPTANPDGTYPWASNQAYSLRAHGKALYLGVMSEPRIYRLDQELWIDVSKGLPTIGFSGVYELWSHSDGFLYASLVAVKGSTAIYRLDTSDDTWEKVGGQGVNGSWIGEGFGWGLSFATHDGALILSATRHPQAAGKFSSVWAYSNGEWNPVGASTAPTKWGEITNFNTVFSYSGNLYLGGGGHPGGNASIWQYTASGWVVVAGFGVRNSWGENFPHTLTSSPRNAVAEYPYRMVQWNDSLVVGFGDIPGAAQLWIFQILE